MTLPLRLVLPLAAAGLLALAAALALAAPRQHDALPVLTLRVAGTLA